MAKIENTVVYPTVTPAMDDLLIATDVSSDNKTVTFLVSDLIGGTGVLQGLQSVLNTGNTATQNMTLVGTMTILGTIIPNSITAAGSVGVAGQILSSTGTGIQWINSPTLSCCALDPVLNVGNTATIDIITSASIQMNGAGQSLALSNNTDITLAANCSINTADDIILGTSSVLNFNTTSVLNDYAGNTGTAGQILTINAAGTGVEWLAGVPVQSMPTLQEVLNAGNTAVGIGINLTATSPLVLDATSNITSAGTNTYGGINTFNGTVELNACVEDSNGVCGTVGQVLTSTGSATLWTNGGGVGLQNLSQVLAVGNTATNDIILNGTIQPTTITDSTSSVGLAGQILTSNGTGLTWVNAACCNLQDTLAAGNTANLGIVLTGAAQYVGPTLNTVQILDSAGLPGTAGQVLSSTGTALQWVPAGGGGAGVTSVTTTDGTFIDLTPNAPAAGAVTVTADLSATGTPSATTFLRGDNTWAVPAGGGSDTNSFLWTETAMVPKQATYTANQQMGINPFDPSSAWNANSTTFYTEPLGTTLPLSLTSVQRFSSSVFQLPLDDCSTSKPNLILCSMVSTLIVDEQAGGSTGTGFPAGTDFVLNVWRVTGGPCASGDIYLAGSCRLAPSATGGVPTCCTVYTPGTLTDRTWTPGDSMMFTWQANSSNIANFYLMWRQHLRFEFSA